MKNAGIKNPKSLPLANKTVGKKQDLNEYYTEEIQSLALFVFGPFLEKYNYDIPNNWKFKNIPFSSHFLFVVGGLLRKIKWKFMKKSSRESIKGSIYGDIQRKEKKTI